MTEIPVIIRGRYNHWLLPAARSCGELGPAYLAKWFGLRSWLYENRRFITLRGGKRLTRAELARWRLFVVSVWHTRKAFTRGDLALVLGCYDLANNSLWAASHDFKKRRGRRLTAKRLEGKGGPVDQDEVRIYALEQLKVRKYGYRKRTAKKYGITADYVALILKKTP